LVPLLGYDSIYLHQIEDAFVSVAQLQGQFLSLGLGHAQEVPTGL